MLNKAIFFHMPTTDHNRAEVTNLVGHISEWDTSQVTIRFSVDFSLNFVAWMIRFTKSYIFTWTQVTSFSSLFKGRTLLDEDLSFLDCSEGGKVPSKSILDVGVEEALKQSGFDLGMFELRGGVYDWKRERKGDTSA